MGARRCSYVCNSVCWWHIFGSLDSTRVQRILLYQIASKFKRPVQEPLLCLPKKHLLIYCPAFGNGMESCFIYSIALRYENLSSLFSQGYCPNLHHIPLYYIWLLKPSQGLQTKEFTKQYLHKITTLICSLGNWIGSFPCSCLGSMHILEAIHRFWLWHYIKSTTNYSTVENKGP